MKLRKIFLLELVIFVFLPVNGSGDINRLFRARNDAANTYAWAKDGAREKVKGLLACGCALGAFKYFRSAKRAGKLVAFMEAAGIGTTVYTLLGFMRKILLNPLIKCIPSIAKKGRIKSIETRALLNALAQRDVRTEDQLPSEEHVRGKTDTKMLEHMRAAIHYGGLEAHADWVEKLMVTEEPDHVGDIPPEVQRFINYINHPDQYRRLGATLKRGLLLTGKPGCGKTTLARRIAYLTQCPFIETSCSSMANTYIGTGPNALKSVFATASSAANVLRRKEVAMRSRKKTKWYDIRPLIARVVKLFCKRQVTSYVSDFSKPAILCLNEIDSITRKRNSHIGEHAEDRRMITEFFNSFDKRPEVVVIGTTNEEGPYFDDALLRPDRLGNPIAMPLPKKSQRYEILQHYMRKLLRVSSDIGLPDDGWDMFSERAREATPDSVEACWQAIVRQTKGFSGDELRHIINEAAMLAGDAGCYEVARQHVQQSLQGYLSCLPETRRACRAMSLVPQVQNPTAGHEVPLLTPQTGSQSYFSLDDNSFDGEEYPGEF